MFLVSIKVPMLKKSGNLFNDPHINVPILKKSGNLFNDPRIHKRAHTIISGNLFNNPRAHTKKVWKLF